MKEERPKQITCSQIEAISLCPGRWRLTLEHWDEVHSQQSPEAAHGEAVHAALEHRARHGGFQFADDTPQAVRDDALACWALLEKAVAMVTSNTWEVALVEERIESISKLWSGRPDVVLRLEPRHMMVVDFKTGRAEVTPSVRNTQLQGLAVLVAHRFSSNNVTVCIIAPHGQEKISLAEYSREALSKANKYIDSVVSAALAPDAELRAGEPQCRFCPVKAYCPELARWTLQPVVTAAPGIVKKPEKAEVREAAKSLSLEQCSKIWEQKQAVGWLYEAIEERLSALSDEELVALGLERSPGRVMRAVADVRNLFMRMKEAFGIGADEFSRLCSVSLAQIEEWICTHHGTSKAEARRVLDKLLEGNVRETTTKPTIRVKRQ